MIRGLHNGMDDHSLRPTLLPNPILLEPVFKNRCVCVCFNLYSLFINILYLRFEMPCHFKLHEMFFGFLAQ